MESNNLIAKTEATINTTVTKVWDALINPDTIKKYMFGTTVTSDWKEGSKITWAGEQQGKPYEDKGEILAIIPEKKLQYSHFSPLSGMADIPENFHTVTIDLSGQDGNTFISLTQDKNATEQAREHSEKNWAMMLTALKKLLEEGGKQEKND